MIILLSFENLYLSTEPHDNMRYLDVNFAANELGYELCAAPPGFYALLDCDLISTCMEKESVHSFQKKIFEMCRKL